MNLNQLLIGAGLAGIVAFMAYRFKALSGSGSLAAFGLGTVVFGLGGIPWAVVLLTFFFSSSALSRFFHKRKAHAEDKYAKGSRRDAGQVLANGGLAGMAVLGHIVFPESALPWIAFCAAFAAANADTWATELGVLGRVSPRLVTTGKPVLAGTSGGVSLVGTFASLAGAALIALTAVFFGAGFNLYGFDLLNATLVILGAGAFGSLVDSYLGATVQPIYWCPLCKKETEKSPTHTCGTVTSLHRGRRWIDNDWVNVACTASAMVFSLFFLLFSH